MLVIPAQNTPQNLHGTVQAAGSGPSQYTHMTATLLTVMGIGLFFGAPLGRAPLMLTALLVAGTIGFAAVGTLFSAMLARTRSRDVLLPILLYPMTVPIVIGGVMGTAAIFDPEPDFVRAQTLLSMLVFFDAIFVTLALWTFAPVMSE